MNIDTAVITSQVHKSSINASKEATNTLKINITQTEGRRREALLQELEKRNEARASRPSGILRAFQKMFNFLMPILDIVASVVGCIPIAGNIIGGCIKGAGQLAKMGIDTAVAVKLNDATQLNLDADKIQAMVSFLGGKLSDTQSDISNLRNYTASINNNGRDIILAERNVMNVLSGNIRG